LTGHGVIAAEMREHKAQRKSVWPAFQGQVIRALVPDIWRKSIDFANVIASKTDQTTGIVEFNDIVSRAALGKPSLLNYFKGIVIKVTDILV
jgi:hypothetical protein